MATTLGDAKITVSLDVKKAMAQLSDLEKKIKEMGRVQIDEIVSEREEEEKKQPVVKERKESSGRLGKIAAAVAAVAGVAVAVEFGLPVVGGALESSIKKIPGLETFAAEFNKKLQSVSNEVSGLFAKVEAFMPTINQTMEIQRSRLLLGEQVSGGESLSLVKTMYEVNEIMSRSERQKSKIGREALGFGIGDLLSGGLMR